MSSAESAFYAIYDDLRCKHDIFYPYGVVMSADDLLEHHNRRLSEVYTSTDVFVVCLAFDVD